MNATLPPIVATRPLVLLTGFLGAGKTTLLRHTLDALAARQLLADVILNDCENPQIDAESLRQRAASVLPLAGSCVCCEGLDELHELALAASRTRHDLLFVELNGTADPLPLLETFTLLESRFLLRPRWQVCVLDATRFGQRGLFHGLESLQLETASHFHLTRDESLTDLQRLRIEQEIRAINPRATRIDAPGLAETLARAIAQQRPFASPATKASAHRPGVPALHDRHHLAHAFTGCQILLPGPLPARSIRRWLGELPPGIIRAKALVRTVENPGTRLLFERVGTEVQPKPLEVPIRDHVPASAILIGPDLDPAEILLAARETLGPDCRLG